MHSPFIEKETKKMLQEDTGDGVINGLISSVNDIEIQKHASSSIYLEDVNLLGEYYKPSVEPDADLVEQSSKKWLRVSLGALGAMLLIATVAFVALTMWSPSTPKEQEDSTIIEISVWEKHFLPNCFETPTNPLCPPNFDTNNPCKEDSLEFQISANMKCKGGLLYCLDVSQTQLKGCAFLQVTGGYGQYDDDCAVYNRCDFPKFDPTSFYETNP